MEEDLKQHKIQNAERATITEVRRDVWLLYICRLWASFPGRPCIALIRVHKLDHMAIGLKRRDDNPIIDRFHNRDMRYRTRFPIIKPEGICRGSMLADSGR